MHRPPTTAMRAVLQREPCGAALVEFALILPLLILLMVGLFDLGFGFWQYMQVQAAAEAGAQYAGLHPTDTAGITAAVNSSTGTTYITPPPAISQVCGCAGNNPFKVADWVGNKCVPAVTCASGSPPGVYALVSVQRSYSPVLPYPGLPDPTMLNGHAYRRIK